VLLFDSFAGAEPMVTGGQLGQLRAVAGSFFASGVDAVARTCGPLVARTSAYFFTRTLRRDQRKFAAATLLAGDIVPADGVVYLLMTEAFGGAGRADACWYVQDAPAASPAASAAAPATAASPDALGEPVVPIGGAAPLAAPTPYPDAGAACFPADATATLASGATVRMDALAVGDRVAVGGGAFSPVFLFTHRAGGGAHEFVRVTTASGAVLRATPGHYVHVAGRGLVAAGAVRVGDRLRLGGGALTPVVSLARVRAAGLFNPQTLSGEIVVDGIVASTYTTAVAPAVAHAVLAPLRAAFRAFRASTAAFDAGSTTLAAWAPRGAPVVDAL
jgi:hypothetical protein